MIEEATANTLSSAVPPDQVLSEIFGFSAFRPGQREIVDRLLNGKNVLAVMPTGAGKSLCYQVPALASGKRTVIVSPLVALMDDQVAGLRANGVNAAMIHSGRHREDNVEDWLRFRAGSATILYLSPERLMTDRMLNALQGLDVGMFIVDEAHCISKWGVSFRPEYEALSDLFDKFPNACFGAFTATADGATQRDIAQKLFRGRGDSVVRGFDRPNLKLSVTPKLNWRKQLANFLEEREGQSGIVYCLSRRLTEEAAGFLQENGVRALVYHAGLDASTRKENQEAFMAEDGVIMVATIAFGMGIDKPDIRFVFHLNLPGSLEAYYQEIGRAGRDGAPSEVMMLYGLDDIRMRRQFIDQDGEDEGHRLREHKRLDALLAYCEAVHCRRSALLTYFGEKTDPCGNCDTCLEPPELVDGTQTARHLLEIVKSTGQSFGAAHVIDVLRGAETEKIAARGHNHLQHYGAGKAFSKPYWQTFIRQAVASGLLSIDIERFGALALEDKGTTVLEGTQTFLMRKIDALAANRTASKGRKAPTTDAANLSESEKELLAHLKTVRREMAKERGVPAYVIFADATLIDMVRLRPKTLDHMALVSGVGPKKLNDFGMRFLAELKRQGVSV